MLPQSGCLSKRTSASVRDTGRKHLHGTYTHTHTHTLLVIQSCTHTKGAISTVHPLNTTAWRTHGGISPTKGTERGEGGARVGVRVLRLDLSLSTTSFSICSWPGSNVRQDGTFSCDWTEGRIFLRQQRDRLAEGCSCSRCAKDGYLHLQRSRGNLSTALLIPS